MSTNTNNKCLFCKIAAEEVPSTKVYEDEQSYAFLDINPVSRGHTLLIPKKHSRNLFNADADTLRALAPILKKLSIAVRDGVDADGINIGINNEPAAGQIIFHTHMHIIPRFSEDKLKMWPGKKYKEGEMKEVAARIKARL